MEQTELRNKIETLCQDEEYVKKLLSLGSAEAISKELEKENIDIEPDQLRTVYKLLKKKESGELSDEELEEVAGGCEPIVAGITGAVILVTGLIHIIAVCAC